MTEKVPADEARGFTLIELLVVIVIVAILAAIAIPVFFRQREKGYHAQVVSSLKNAATTMEGWGAENGGDYEPPHGDGAAAVDMTWLGSQDWRPTQGVEVDIITADAAYFCLEGTHAQVGTLNLQFHSGEGTVADGSCPP